MAPSRKVVTLQHESAPVSQADLREYLAVLRYRKWSIALTTIVVVASALFFSFRQVPIYTSETRVLVRPSTPAVGVPPPLVNLDTERALIDSAAVAKIVRDGLHPAPSIEALLQPLDVSVETNTEILDIRYSDPDPLHAQRLAQSFADGYIRFRQEQAQQQIASQSASVNKQIDGARARIADLEAEIAAEAGPSRQATLSAERDSLIARLGVLQQELESIRSTAGSQGGGEVVQPAGLPSAPSSPDPIRDGLLALLVGLALGVGLAFLRERLDDRLRGRHDLEERIGAPVLATIPKVEGWRRRDRIELVAASAPKSGAAEAYRTLRTNFQFIARDDGFRMLLVVSAAAGEGKTTTVANLAVALAQGGKRVIAVSCDLRKPRLHRFFALEKDVGVSSLVSGQGTVPDAVRRAAIPNLMVLPSGPVPPNPAELLGSEEMDRLLDVLRQSADFLIVDTPPLLAVADALILAPRSDGVLIVTDAATTTRGEAAHARELLEQVNANVIGGIFNNFDRAAAKYYSYSYRYYDTYGYTSDEAAEGPAGNGRAKSSESAGRRR